MFVSPADADDRRLAALRGWAVEQLGRGLDSLSPASGDASFRRYFRLRAGDISVIAMDAPPPHEDCRPFVRVASLLMDAGVHVPEVLAQDLEWGFLLLTDLGACTYLDALAEGDADALFADAIDALIKWQLASQPGVLPEYDRALLRRELSLFPEWYVGRHLRVALSPARRQVLETAFRRLEDSALAQPRVYVHRDYMPRNLMVCDPNPGVLDFQDAVHGPIAYDVLSLFKDAFVSWEEHRIVAWTRRYWERATEAGLPVYRDFEAFRRAFDWIGLQRHLKVAGIFARIRYRDGKAQYLQDAPRFIEYIRGTASRYDEFVPLLGLIDELEERAADTDRDQ